MNNIMIDNNMQFVDIFEQKICQYTGFKHAVCVDCCTNGILLSLICANTPKTQILTIPKNTYLSVPMILKTHGFTIEFINLKWKGFYEVGNGTHIYDSATDFHENMVNDYPDDAFVCVSFQQKKRLPLGRGGVILFNNNIYENILRRLRYDGRNPNISDADEIKNNPDEIIVGYHCYMEPDKAALGILKINQKHLLSKYKQHSYEEYPDLTQLKIW